MPLTVAKLIAEERPFTWHYLGEDVAVVYRPGVLTVAWDEQALPKALAQALVSIEVIGGDGAQIEPTEEVLEQTLPVPAMRHLAKAIYADASVDPTTAGTSGAT